MKKSAPAKKTRFQKITKKPKAQKAEPHMGFAHDRPSTRKQILAWMGIVVFLALGTSLAVLYARGYRFSLGQGEPRVSKTGILNVTSTPQGSQVYINNNLTTATNNSINLTPGKYTVKVAKDGYSDWQKDIEIKEEEVTSANARLFPKSPTLQSISTFGVEEAIVDPTGTKLAFKIASASARQNGIYMFDMTQRPLPILQGQGSSQLVDDTADTFSRAHISFSPDGRELLASISAVPTEEEPDSLSQTATYYLLRTDEFNDDPQNITATIFATLDLWEEQKQSKETARLKSLKKNVADFYNENFRVIAHSPDEEKILYQASNSTEMPIFMNPRRIGNNFLYERRDLEKNAVYVYDIKEDMNTRVVEPTEDICIDDTTGCSVSFSWFPDSEHLVYVYDGKINIVEDDGANMTTIYAGPFINHYVFPWPDGSRMVILTNLGNLSVAPTLYTIGLK